MFSFVNDYSEGAAPEVLEALLKTNDIQLPGYGLDDYSMKAAELIRKVVDDANVDVHFITGGTPCNILAIASALKDYEAVIACASGHINVHETGAIENTGHKILIADSADGKIIPESIAKICDEHLDEHMVKPKMVFISDSTEYGTIYTKDELLAIREVCDRYGLYLYLDGARIGCALMAKGNDLTLPEIAKLTDMFYIGGTKNGALIGEAFVIRNPELKKEFRYHLKQKGMMLAKTRVVSTEFIALFENGLYFELAKNADIMAQALKKVFTAFDIPMFIDSSTNQIFPILRNDVFAKLQEKYLLGAWGPYDSEHTTVRFVCSWATKKEDILEFSRDFIAVMKEFR